MTRYGIEFTASAARSVRKLDPPVRRRVLDAIERLRDDPRPPASRRLTADAPVWRLRVADYRVIYEVLEDAVLVSVVRVGHRREVYRG